MVTEGSQRLDLAVKNLQIELKSVGGTLDDLVASVSDPSTLRNQVLNSIKNIFRAKMLKFSAQIDSLKSKSDALYKKESLTANSFETYSKTRDELKHRVVNPPRNSESEPMIEGRNLQTMGQMEEVHKQRSMKTINKALDKVVTSYKKMSEMVSVHEEMFADIEMKTGVAKREVSGAKKVLQKIYVDVSGNRALIIKFFVVFTLVAVMYVLLK